MGSKMLASCLDRLLGSPEVVDRDSGDKIVEQYPMSEKIQLALLWSNWLGWLSTITPWLRSYLERGTIRKGIINNDPASAAAIPAFVADYAVDVDECEFPVDQYKTLNEFFTRKLKSGLRPVFEPQDGSAAVQPCDCRVVVYPTVSEAKRIWIKGARFSASEFIGSEFMSKGNFTEGSVVVSRLCPTDYHRFHSPVVATLKRKDVVEMGALYLPVKSMGVLTPVDVFLLNKRKCALLHSTEFGKVMFVMVGANHVASLQVTCLSENNDEAKLEKGDELGLFAYGGSTVVMLFEENAIQFDSDLVANSARGVETLVKMGTSLGRAKQKAKNL